MGPHSGGFPLVAGAKTISLRVLCDNSVIEAFADGGRAAAPKEFLGAVENGIRNTAKGSYKAMGKLALHSEERWNDENLNWRKRESYITACRKILQAESLLRWDKESQENVKLRVKLSNTFDRRHLPHSTAKAEKRLAPWVCNPPEW